MSDPFDLDQSVFSDLCLGDVGLAQSTRISHDPYYMGNASVATCDNVADATREFWNTDAGSVSVAYHVARGGWR